MKKLLTYSMLIVFVLMSLCFSGCTDGVGNDDAAEFDPEKVIIEEGNNLVGAEPFSPGASGMNHLGVYFVYIDDDNADAKDAVFSVTATDGVFIDRSSENIEEYKYVLEGENLKNGGQMAWISYDRESFTIEDGELVQQGEYGAVMLTREAEYFKTVARIDGHIVAFTVTKLHAFPLLPVSQLTNDTLKGLMRMYVPVELGSGQFPKVDGEYQNITEEYVTDLMDDIIAEKGDTVPEGYENLIAFESQ